MVINSCSRHVWLWVQERLSIWKSAAVFEIIKLSNVKTLFVLLIQAQLRVTGIISIWTHLERTYKNPHLQFCNASEFWAEININTDTTCKCLLVSFSLFTCAGLSTIMSPFRIEMYGNIALRTNKTSDFLLVQTNCLHNGSSDYFILFDFGANLVTFIPKTEGMIWDFTPLAWKSIQYYKRFLAFQYLKLLQKAITEEADWRWHRREEMVSALDSKSKCREFQVFM